MRKLIAVLPLVAVSACSGGGPETAGSVAAPAGATAATVSGGSGTGVTSGNSGANANPNAQTSFLSISAEKSFDAVGGFQSLAEDRGTGGVLYAGNASTVRAPTGTVSYNPRDGIFTVKFADTKADLTTDLRFQDPAHRTDFNNSISPQSGVPDLKDFNYLEAIGATSDDTLTFFYQRPGTSTVYVSLAGFVRNNTPTGGTRDTFERGAFVFGDQTARAQVPASGGGTYKGGFLATMVANPTLDTTGKSTFFQWIQGSSTTTVDFGKGTVGLALNGSVTQATFDGANVPNASLSIPTGATFNAAGSASIDLVRTGGFTGAFQSASFTDAAGKVTAVDFASVSASSSTAGASSIDGAFYGPNAVNVGGSVRIVGGVPDQRVDILGAFTGAKQP